MPNAAATAHLYIVNPLSGGLLASLFSTPPPMAERAAFQSFLDGGWAEVTRAHAPGYTYWDYYRQRFERDRGLKIDFVLGSSALAERVTGAFVDRDERSGKGASDHAPVVVDLAD